jgi:CelD/BcsL family acetyltransferase involved in cellulose biosynthesis
LKDWELRPVELKFRLGELTLAKRTLHLQVKIIGLTDEVALVDQVAPPTDPVVAGSRGFMVRGQPIKKPQPPLQVTENYLCYAHQQYRHYFIDLAGSFDDYKKKFSSKTRSTIARKVKKYSEYCGGVFECRAYSQPPEMAEFFQNARIVSARSYQERLLDAGLPTDDDFLAGMLALAERDQVRGYILFHDARPVSYLYCPAHEGVLLYSYLGYDSDYHRLSVGTVLQWFALERLFGEQRFLFFDFSEGQGEHKRMFATHDRLEANVIFVDRGLASLALVRAHLLFDRFGGVAGRLLQHAGLKSSVRRLLRSRWA